MQRIQLEPGNVLLILDGSGTSDDAVVAVENAKRDALAANTVVVLAAGGGGQYADVVVDFVDGEPKVVKNRRGATD